MNQLQKCQIQEQLVQLIDGFMPNQKVLVVINRKTTSINSFLHIVLNSKSPQTLILGLFFNLYPVFVVSNKSQRYKSFINN